MRITFVHKTANFSGGNRVVATYAERLAARGHQVCVVSAKDPRPRPLRKLLNRVRGRSFPVGDGRSWLDTLPVEHRVLERARPVRADDLPDADVVVATWWETAEWVAALPRTKGAPAYFIQGVEWTIDDMPLERVKQTWRLPLHKIVIAEFMADIARREFGDADLSHVPNAVDSALFHAPPRERNAVPTVGFMEVGPLAIKGGDITRAALSLAKERCPELRGVCFGRSAPPPERALPSWVEMHVSPSPDALRALYARCDVFVHASRAEGFGLPLLEAMACRTPVAATPAGAAPELLPHGGGQLVPHDDPAALADALVGLATLPPAAWRARSDAAHARATGYTLEDATERMEAALARAQEKAELGQYANASARGDRGPAPPMADRISALLRSSKRSSGVPTTWHANGLLSPSELEDAREELTGVARRPSRHGTANDGSWTASGSLSPGTQTLLACITHPVSVAAIEAATGANGLLMDPYAREQGLFTGCGEGSWRSFRLELEEPPLRRRFTLVLPLSTSTVEVCRHIPGSLRGPWVQRHALAAGDLLLVPAGREWLVHTAGLRALIVPLYSARYSPTERSGTPERTLKTTADTYGARVARAALDRAVHLRWSERRARAALHDHLLGLH